MEHQLKTNTLETRLENEAWLSERKYILRIPNTVFGCISQW